MAARALKLLAEPLIDAAGLVGMCLVAYGAWLVYEPAGFIVGGVMLLAGALIYSR